VSIVTIGYKSIITSQDCSGLVGSSEMHFGEPVKMHDDDLVDPATGKINLDLTKVPEGLSGNCNISLVLDALMTCPDVNRSNNIENFMVQVSGSNATVNADRTCKVLSDFASDGELLTCFI